MSTDTAGWVVRYRLCDMFWAEANRHVTDYSDVWDDIPWHDDLTEANHGGAGAEAKARDQYDTLLSWERTRSQPVRDVTLHVVTTSYHELPGEVPLAELSLLERVTRERDEARAELAQVTKERDTLAATAGNLAEAVANGDALREAAQRVIDAQDEDQFEWQLEKLAVALTHADEHLDLAVGRENAILAGQLPGPVDTKADHAK